MFSQRYLFLVPFLFAACASQKAFMKVSEPPRKIVAGARIGIHFTDRARGPGNGLDSNLFGMFQEKFLARMTGAACGGMFRPLGRGQTAAIFQAALEEPRRAMVDKEFSVAIPAAPPGDSLGYALVIDEAAFGSYSGGSRDVAVAAGMAAGGMAGAIIASSGNSMSSREEFKFVLWDYQTKDALAYGIARLKVKESQGDAGEFDADAKGLQRFCMERLFAESCRMSPSSIRR